MAQLFALIFFFWLAWKIPLTRWLIKGMLFWTVIFSLGGRGRY